MSEYLDNIYEADDLRDYYDRWADTYDKDLTQNGYKTPTRCAEALARYTDSRSAPILDFACGSGLSGIALAKQGFTTIDGADISPGMLDKARETGVYRHLFETPEDRLDITPGTYSAVVAVGAISVGAAPPEFMTPLAEILPKGGLFVMSFNGHTMETDSYPAALKAEQEAGRLELLFEEEGEHVPGIDLRSTVYALRRT